MSLQVLQESLQNEIGLIGQFIAALEAEAATLLEPGGNEALEASTKIKNTLAELLVQEGKKRDTLLLELGGQSGKAGLDAMAASQPQIQALTAKLFEQAERARQLNASNGYIIETYLKYNQQAFDTLRSLAGMGKFYDARGRAQSAPAKSRGIRAG